MICAKGYSFKQTRYVGRTISQEKNDCAVRATMSVMGISYDQAHKALAEDCNRKPRRGTPTYDLERWLDRTDRMEKLGVKTRQVRGISRDSRQTVKKFLRLHPKGKFFCLMRGHAFAVVDGSVVDTWLLPGGSRIFYAWEVVGIDEDFVETDDGKTARKHRITPYQILARVRKEKFSGTVTELTQLFDKKGTLTWDATWRECSKFCKTRMYCSEMKGRRKVYSMVV